MWEGGDFGIIYILTGREIELIILGASLLHFYRGRGYKGSRVKILRAGRPDEVNMF